MSDDIFLVARCFKGQTCIFSRGENFPPSLDLASAFIMLHPDATSSDYEPQAYIGQDAFADRNALSKMIQVPLGSTIQHVVSFLQGKVVIFIIPLQPQMPVIENPPVRSVVDVLMNPHANLLPAEVADADIRDGRDRLHNDIIKYLRSAGVGFLNQELGKNGAAEKFVKKLSGVLWILDGQAEKFKNKARVHALPEEFVFGPYRSVSHGGMVKKKHPQLNQEAIVKMMSTVSELYDMYRVRSTPWSKVRETVRALQQSLVSYGSMLKVQAESVAIQREQQKANSSIVEVAPACDNIEFYVIPAKSKKDISAIQAAIYKQLHDALLQKGFYEYLDISLFVNGVSRSNRRNFIMNLAFVFPVRVFRRHYKNNKGSASFIWRIPVNEGDEPTESSRVMFSINANVLPTYHVRTRRSLFVRLLSGISVLKSRHIQVLYQEVTGDDSTLDVNSEAYDEVHAIMTSGLPLADIPTIVDNAVQARKGKYDVWFAQARRYCNLLAVPDQRRNGENLYIPMPSSIRVFINDVNKYFQDENSADPPPVPSAEYVRLAFQPSARFRMSASKHKGFLDLCHRMQTRTVRKANQDSHWCAALRLYLFGWIVDNRDYIDVQFVDDKSSIPIGDPDCPVECVPRQKKTICIPGQTAAVTDHDFVRCHITPSVTLKPDIPQGHGEHSWVQGVGSVILKCAVFEASSAMRHETESYMNMTAQQLSKPVKAKYHDGGPDHRNTFFSVQLANICFFLKTNSDVYVVARVAGGSSYLNPAERLNSTLNLGCYGFPSSRTALENVEDEKAIKSCGSKKAFRTAALSNPRLPQLLHESIQSNRDILTSRFSKLGHAGRPIEVYPPATQDNILSMSKELLKIDPNLKIPEFIKLSKTEAFSTSPLFAKWFVDHVVETKYMNMYFKGASDPTLQLNQSTFALAKRFPFPRLLPDSDRYMPYAQARDSMEAPYTLDCSSMPSWSAQRAKTQASKAKTAVASTVQGLKPTATRVIGFITCNDCSKPRVLFAELPLTDTEQEEFQSVREEFFYYCGGSVAPPDNNFNDIVGTLTELSCDLPIETIYYSAVKNVRPHGYVELLCFHCGSDDNVRKRAPEGRLLQDYSFLLPTCPPCHEAGRISFRLRTRGRKRKADVTEEAQ